MTYERRIAGIVDRLIEEVIFDPTIDIDTKSRIRGIRDDLSQLMRDIDEEEARIVAVTG